VALANDLLEQAYHLARREPKRPRQASLRRAVSNGYYALFHLLILEATRNWKQSSQRAALGRYFQHGSMAKASDKQKADCNRFLTSSPPPAPGPDTDCMAHLQTVSLAFYQAYQQRQTADYDTVKQWTRTEALAIIDSVDAAFKAWPQIRNHKFAHNYFTVPSGRPEGKIMTFARRLAEWLRLLPNGKVMV
jgi:uncharacterized protein (UPF0332 family)